MALRIEKAFDVGMDLLRSRSSEINVQRYKSGGDNRLRMRK